MYSINEQSFDGLISLYNSKPGNLVWNSVFVLPIWLKAWCRTLGDGAEPRLLDIREDGHIIGIAALQFRGDRASFIGSADVCDYMDFTVVRGKETAFFNVLLDRLKTDNVGELYLESLLPDSVALTCLPDLARERDFTVTTTLQDVSLDLELPETWEEYLGMLTPKQRREVNRKLRRLDETGHIEYVSFEGAETSSVIDVFLRLLRISREDKAAFMTDHMEAFFREVARNMAEAGFLRFGILNIDSLPVAVVMCLDYNGRVYLYNSGYDIEYSHVSAGLLSKVLSIRDSIDRRRKVYDFLKGAEEYKYRLGGREIPIYNCLITMK